MPPLEIFEGKSITWILLISLLTCVVFLARFTQDFVSKTIARFQKELDAQQAKSELRETKLMEELKISNQTNKRLSELMSVFETNFKQINASLESIMRKQ